MRLTVLSYCNPLSTQVIGSIHERHPVSAIVQVLWQSRPQRTSRWTRLRKSPVGMLQQTLDRRVEKWQHARRMQRVTELFSERAKSLPDVPIYTVGCHDLHQPESLEMFASLQSDVLLVSHAPLLKPVLFEQPKVATLNIHWGIAPNYCGEHTLFWPLYFRDYAQIGVTIHRIDDGIDTGPILAQGFPAMLPMDDESELLAHCAGMASDLTSEVLDAAVAGDPLLGKRSLQPPKNFLRKDRHAIQSLRYWMRRKLWRESLPTLEARRDRYFSPLAPQHRPPLIDGLPIASNTFTTV